MLPALPCSLIDMTDHSHTLAPQRSSTLSLLAVVLVNLHCELPLYCIVH